MHRLAIPLTSLLLVLGTAGVVAAEIYRWTDDAGRLHFSQSLDDVPPKHRAAARGKSSGTSGRGHFQTYSGGQSQAAMGGSARSYRIPFRREMNLMRITATVNGHLDMPFYVDTGASGVSIPASYANRLGIHIGPDTDRVSVRTANGVIQVPFVRIDSVRIGGAKVEGLMATINPTMSIGLLGGAFFNHFNYEVDPAASLITLVPNHAVTSGLGEDHWRRRFRDLRGSLSELERYLEEREGLRPGRRADLERKREQLRDGLRTLENEADLDDIPTAWRH